MKRHTPTTAILQMARAVFLALSAVFAGLLTVVLGAPKLVDTLDDALRSRYIAPYEADLQRVSTLLERDDRDGAIVVLERTRNALRGVRKGERLDPARRSTLHQLTTLYHGAGRDDEAMAVLREWIDFDSRDLRAARLEAEWLGREGAEQLDLLIARFPSLERRRTRPPPTETAGQGPAGVEQELLMCADQLASSVDPHWQVFWDDGRGFREETSVRLTAQVDSDDRIRFATKIPRGVLRLRIDGPPKSIWTKDLRVTLAATGVSPVVIDLWAAGPRNAVRALGGGALEMEGGDPHIHVPLPGAIARAHDLTAAVSGWVMPAPPAACVELLRRPGLDKAIRELSQNGELVKARRVQRARDWIRGSSSHDDRGVGGEVTSAGP